MMKRALVLGAISLVVACTSTEQPAAMGEPAQGGGGATGGEGAEGGGDAGGGGDGGAGGEAGGRPSGLSCSGGTTECSGSCVDTDHDPDHCGDCDTVCGSGLCDEGSCTVPQYCKTILAADPSATSGVYAIDPDGMGPSPSYSSYCDMSSDGGGWTLVLAYAHDAGENEPLVPGTPPTDPENGYSHLTTEQLLDHDIGELRFYCETDDHSRTVHFKTQNPLAVAYVRGIGANSPEAWNTDFVLLPGHDAWLPLATNAANNASGEQRMTDFPFYVGDTYHWSIGEQFQCDDSIGPGSFTTLHQIWIR